MTAATGPAPADMLRAFGRIRRDPLGFLTDCSRSYGDVVEFPMPHRQVLFANHPDAARAVLQTGARDHDRATVQYRTLSIITGNGLLTSDGELWRRQRRLMQPAFHRGVLDTFVEHIDIAVDRLLATWSQARDGDVIDVDEAMMRTALEAVGRALFSHDLSGEAEDLVHAVISALDVVVARARNPLAAPLDWPTPANLRLRQGLRTLDRTVNVMLRARRAADDRGADPAHDLLAMLLAARDDDGGGGFDDRQLRDEIVTLIVAGHETVASALTWTWYLLAQDEQAVKRLQAEVDEVLGGRRPGFDDLPRLTWTRAVVDEALRLYPPAWVISRRAITGGELLGREVAPGAFVFVSPYVLQRSPQWWSDPDRFDPERFVRAEDERAAHERYAYIPFGAGPNLCIGRDLALMEATLLVASVAQEWTLDLVPGHAVHVDPLVTIRPRGGLPMVLRRRSA